MLRATITIPDDLAAEIERFLAEHDERDLSDVIADALRQYLPSEQVWMGRQYYPARKRPFIFTPAETGSGFSDVSVNHDIYLVEAIVETRPVWAIPIDELDDLGESDVSVEHDRYLADAWFARRESQPE
jgi:hypothetical protein